VSPASGFGSNPGSGSNPGRDPFAPPPSRPNALSLDTGSVRPVAPPPGRDPFGAKEEVPQGLELDMRGRTPSDDARRAGAVAPGSSARLEAGSSSASLSVDRDAASEAYRIRCPKHGLFYDKRKASGCRKCLEPGRKMAAAITSANPWVGFRIYDFGENASARAFVGIGIALLVGLMPAAFHAMRVGVRDLHRLRNEQELLSHRPASEDVVRRFDELEAEVSSSHSRAMRNTAIIWFVVTGGAMAAWYKFT
jgi:hypothetical protein